MKIKTEAEPVKTEQQTSEYPQHEKLKAVKDQSQAIGEFLEWLNEKDFVVAKFDARNCMLYQEYLAMDRILAEHFEIDLNALEAEKRAMLAEAMP